MGFLVTTASMLFIFFGTIIPVTILIAIKHHSVGIKTKDGEFIYSIGEIIITILVFILINLWITQIIRDIKDALNPQNIIETHGPWDDSLDSRGEAYVGIWVYTFLIVFLLIDVFHPKYFIVFNEKGRETIQITKTFFVSVIAGLIAVFIVSMLKQFKKS